MTGAARRALEAAFLGTCYRAQLPDGPVDLRICVGNARLDQWLAEVGAHDWAFISADKPGARAAGAQFNRRRREALAKRVHAAGWTAVSGEGIPAAGNWLPEKSLLIAGIDRFEAERLARAFVQLAIIVGQRGGVARLHWLDSEAQH